MIQWADKDSSKINWVAESQISKQCARAINGALKAAKAIAIEGWSHPIATPQYRPIWKFDHTKVGPKIRTRRSKFEIFSSFIDGTCIQLQLRAYLSLLDDLLQSMVVEINRAAHRSFDQAVLEREEWRLNKLSALQAWAKKMESKYDGMFSTTVTQSNNINALKD